MANLKAGTLIAGNVIWNYGNLPLTPSGKDLFYDGNQIYTTVFKPTAADVKALPIVGGELTGNLSITTDSAQLSINSGADKNSQLRLTEASGAGGLYIKYQGVDNNRTYFGTIKDNTQKGSFYIERDSAQTVFEVNPILSVAQSTASAALTRKDYVDNLITERIKVNGSYFQVGSSKWLQASSDTTGFLPDSASTTTGRSLLGTSDWWFRAAHIKTINTSELNVDGTTIKQTGNITQFLV